jgi:conjugative transfer region protein (TIGR03750 family)
MILNNINHKMPIYKDCTLGEMLFVGLMAFIGLFISLTLLAWLLIGYWYIGLLISVFSLVHTTRFLCGKLQKMKAGKPYGYYQQLILRNLSQNKFLKKFIPLPFIQRIGKWSTRRM